MITQTSLRRLLLGALSAAAIAAAGISAPIAIGALTPAMAQQASDEDIQAALDAYGHWIRHPRYGAVWIPDGVPPDWRPYEYGHWVYTDDWGWYWVSDESEDDWGWVAYHYGRWAFEPGIGWFWVPGDEWGPAWVDWRYGGDNVGWAPLPPDDLVDAYDDQPDYWVFVPLRYVGEPMLRRHFVPRERRIVILRETRIVNRPVRIEGRRIWVNPGLPPVFIASRAHVNISAYQVRPRVFARTTSVQGAITVHAQDLKVKGAIKTVAPVTIQRANTQFKPQANVVAPQPLGKKDPGKLGPRPPLAATVNPTPPGGPQPQQQLKIQQQQQEQLKIQQQQQQQKQLQVNPQAKPDIKPEVKPEVKPAVKPDAAVKPPPGQIQQQQQLNIQQQQQKQIQQQQQQQQQQKQIQQQQQQKQLQANPQPQVKPVVPPKPPVVNPPAKPVPPGQQQDNKNPNVR